MFLLLDEAHSSQQEFEQTLNEKASGKFRLVQLLTIRNLLLELATIKMQKQPLRCDG